jgi:aromatic amino acid transport protein AroP
MKLGNFVVCPWRCIYLRVAVMMIPGWILCLMVAYQFKRRKLKAEQSVPALEADI